MMDHRRIHAAAQWPPEIRRHSRQSKYIFRRSAACSVCVAEQGLTSGKKKMENAHIPKIKIKISFVENIM